MLPTSEFLNEMSRAQAEEQIQTLIRKDEIQKALLQKGVSADEISARVANLSDQEIKNLSGQLQAAKAGGDILYTILIVLLIIFVAKRI